MKSYSFSEVRVLEGEESMYSESNKLV